LRFSQQDKFPGLIDFFFHSDKSVRHSAYVALGQAESQEETSEVLDTLLAVLDNPQRAADHLLALHAIRWHASRFTKALPHARRAIVDQLQKVLVHGKSDLLPETIVLLSRLSQESYNSPARKVDPLVSEQRRKELAEAVKAIKNRGGGGF